MTLPFSRRSRERKLAIDGDFPETGESITEILERVRLSDTELLSHVHHDDTRPFDGASAGTMPLAEAHREAGLRQAVTLADPDTELEVNAAGYPTGNVVKRADPDTQPLRLRARTAPPRYAPAPAPNETGPMPKLSKYAARPRPQRPADGFIPAWSDLLGQFIMLCGVCPPERRSRYADPIAGRMPFAFEALRVSAWTSGWRLDAFDRWGCPACQLTPAWHARYTVIHYDDQAAQARLARDDDGERWYRGAAEHALIRDVADAANHGKHRVMS